MDLHSKTVLTIKGDKLKRSFPLFTTIFVLTVSAARSEPLAPPAIDCGTPCSAALSVNRPSDSVAPHKSDDAVQWDRLDLGAVQRRSAEKFVRDAQLRKRVAHGAILFQGREMQ